MPRLFTNYDIAIARSVLPEPGPDWDGEHMDVIVPVATTEPGYPMAKFECCYCRRPKRWRWLLVREWWEDVGEEPDRQS